MKQLFEEQFYTDDFDQEIIDFIVREGWDCTDSQIDHLPNLAKPYLVYGTGVNHFWTGKRRLGNYLTKQQLMEKIGMTNKQFTKDDLKTGMVIKYRGGSVESDKYGRLALVVGDHLVQANEYDDLGRYTDDLLCNGTLDIVEVFDVVNLSTGLSCIFSWKLKSIWKREEKSPEQIEIENIQLEMDKLNRRLGELKGKI